MTTHAGAHDNATLKASQHVDRIDRRAMLLTTLAWTASAVRGRGQMRVPKASLTPSVASGPTARRGGRVRLLLDVQLSEGLHVQSDKPRDPSLIATALTLTLPDTVRVSRLVYPKATDLTQPGLAQPLAVFGHAFVIAAELTISREQAAGTLVIAGTLRYQACNDTTCFPPTRGQTSWALTVV